jgi:hypothetical protein
LPSFPLCTWSPAVSGPRRAERALPVLNLVNLKQHKQFENGWYGRHSTESLNPSRDFTITQHLAVAPGSARIALVQHLKGAVGGPVLGFQYKAGVPGLVAYGHMPPTLHLSEVAIRA